MNKSIKLLALCFFLLCSIVVFGTNKKETVNPTLHYRLGTIKMGDIIPFYWKGEYHVFYLKGQDWAHLVSRDLVKWNVLPDALKKGEDPLGPDGEAIWTGSVVEHKGTFYLYYTGKNMNDPKGDQKVMQARSNDLIHWTKMPDLTFYADGKIYWNKTINGAIDDKHIYHHQAFRDPHVVWNEKEQVWWLGLHAMKADASSPGVGLYTSKDLTHWTAHEPLVIYPTSVSGDCPDLFQINGNWIVNLADFHYVKVTKPQMVNPPVLVYDCGDLRVAKTLFDGKRRIIIGWIGDYKDAKDAGEYEWGGCFSMPRELYSDKQGLLYQRPIKEVINLYKKPVVRIKNGLKLNTPVKNIPQEYMLTTTLNPSGSKGKATLFFRQSSSDSNDGYHFSIDFKSKEIEIGSKYKSHKRVCNFDTEKPINIQLFIADNVIECFVNNAFGFTFRAYDCKGTEAKIVSTDDNIKVETFAVATMLK